MSPDLILEALKALLLGVVEGITEWLPISSTGHMILVDEFVQLNVSPNFLELFLVVIQIGSIMAVIISFRHKLNPVSRTKDEGERRKTWRMWGMVEKPIGKHGRVEAIDPNDPEAVDKALFKITDPYEMDWKTALKIGCFEVLAIIPGTSRSGATIIGGMLCGCSRTAAAEFTFFLAIPVMFGWGLVKAVKFFLDGIAMTQTEIVVLVVGILSAFVMGMIAIRFLMGYIKQNDFTVFGVYRIIIGLIVLGYFGTKALGLM